MKKIFFFLISFIYVSVTLAQNSKINRLTSLLQYGQYIHPIMEAKHYSIYKEELRNMNKDFEVVSTFQVDTKGNIINLDIKSDTSNRNVKEYISKLIQSTSGSWLPQIKNSEEVISDTITCCFFFFLKKLTDDDRIRQLEEDLQKNFSTSPYSTANEASKILAERSQKNNYCFVSLRI